MVKKRSIVAIPKVFELHRSTDRVGKPFKVLPNGFRHCVVCEKAFSRRSAPNHALKVCYPDGAAHTFKNICEKNANC